jgi:hypothetical protein
LEFLSVEQSRIGIPISYQSVVSNLEEFPMTTLNKILATVFAVAIVSLVALPAQAAFVLTGRAISSNSNGQIIPRDAGTFVGPVGTPYRKPFWNSPDSGFTGSNAGIGSITHTYKDSNGADVPGFGLAWDVEATAGGLNLGGAIGTFPDRYMMHFAWLDKTTGGNGSAQTITLTGIPYDDYEIVTYTTNQFFAGRGARVTVTGSVSGSTSGTLTNTPLSGGFTGGSTGDGYSLLDLTTGGGYIIHSEVSGSTATISWKGPLDPAFAAEGWIHGFQILELEVLIPEPSTFVLSALGLLSLGFVGWRRRRRR